MAARKRFKLGILCPNCGANGEALVSEGDTPEMSAFEVDEYPDGFSEQQPSAHRHETRIRCECGQEFYL
jgi:Zn ribbon nucleic-acid-binding protein